LLFELAGPRAKLFFDPKQTRASIATCGGLCPGLKDAFIYWWKGNFSVGHCRSNVPHALSEQFLSV
jgi:hypothetical protein